MENLKIAVIGGTGRTGSYLVKELLSRNYEINLLLRQEGKEVPDNPRLHVIKGNVLSRDDMSQLLAGCSAVISTLGQKKGEPAVFRKSAEIITGLMKEMGIRRYIQLAGLTIDCPGDRKSRRTRILSALMRLSFPKVIKDRQEDFRLLSASGLDWTLVRVPLIVSDEAAGNLKCALNDCPGKQVNTGDLAVFLADQLNDNQYIRKAPFISG